MAMEVTCNLGTLLHHVRRWETKSRPCLMRSIFVYLICYAARSEPCYAARSEPFFSTEAFFFFFFRGWEQRKNGSNLEFISIGILFGIIFLFMKNES